VWTFSPLSGRIVNAKQLELPAPALATAQAVFAGVQGGAPPHSTTSKSSLASHTAMHDAVCKQVHHPPAVSLDEQAATPNIA